MKLSYNVEEAAAEVGVSEDTIRRAIAGKRLIPHYPTSRPVIHHADLEAWLLATPDEKPRRSS